MITWWDHALAFVLVVVLPVTAVMKLRRVKERAKLLGGIARIEQYRKTVAMQWALVGALGVLWFAQGRALPHLLPAGRPLAIGAAVTLVVLLLLAVQWRGIANPTQEQLESFKKQLAPLADLLPRSPGELGAFRLLAVTAGICEEILFRGFLLWYLGHWMSAWAAVVVGAIAFGVAHLYQGAAGIVKTLLVGLFMGALYRLSGSLLWPAILHAAVDLQGGAAAYRVLTDES